jgi:hypothetical protein
MLYRVHLTMSDRHMENIPIRPIYMYTIEWFCENWFLIAISQRKRTWDVIMIRGKRKEDLLRNSLIKMLSGKIMDVKMVLWETCFEILQAYFSWHHRRDLDKTLISLLSLICFAQNGILITSQVRFRWDIAMRNQFSQNQSIVYIYIGLIGIFSIGLSLMVRCTRINNNYHIIQRFSI